ncbi:hypothetical protein Acsp06_46640 [Actinomycetospora sp. NBRC 106375]|uniref:heparin lyase I family protein n=1 Tax=Actinomycetospora sp. NBRC 106375 TaxID=3032207 RepID=UPI0024A0DA33|nr:heparin lyase I family protein [Actinomycetospora sp. NBRC 106375]GLZ48479.1 hypothetical protein Acsp06_46640 [Actinomycetospora sp. NBRC 106375]
MTDVVTHADPSPGDGRRRARGHRAQRGLRTPGSDPSAHRATGHHGTETLSSDGGSSARHRRAAEPVAAAELVGTGRHESPVGRLAFDPSTGSWSFRGDGGSGDGGDADAPTVETPVSAPAAVHHAAGPRTGGHRAPEPSAGDASRTAGPRTGSHRAPETAETVTSTAAPVAVSPAGPWSPGPRTGGHRAVEPRHGGHRAPEPPTAVRAAPADAATTTVRAASHEAATTTVRAASDETATTAVRAAETTGTSVGRSRVHGHRTGPGTGATGVVSSTGGGHGTTGPSHAAARRTGLPLRATIGLIGGGGVAALFALTSIGSPLIPSAPAEQIPTASAPAGLYEPAPDAATAPPALPVAPPATSTAPAAQGPAPVIGALFDLAAGSLSELFDNSGDSGLVENGSKPRIVDNPDAPGRQAWQFALGPGGKRSEVLPQGPGTEPRDGDEQYVRYTARLSDDFPTNTGSWQLLLQWHHALPSGSPPLALQVTQGQLMMVSGGDDMRSIGAIGPGDTIDLTMHIRFSQDPSQSSVTVWRGGQATGVTDWSPRAGTMSTASAYMKMGMYRDPNIRQGGSVLVTDLKIGRDARGIGGLGPRPVD